MSLGSRGGMETEGEDMWAMRSAVECAEASQTSSKNQLLPKPTEKEASGFRRKDVQI